MIKFGPARNHPMYLFDNIFSDFFGLFTAIIIGAFNGNLADIIWNSGTIIVLIFLKPISKLFSLFTMRITIDESNIIRTSGLISRSSITIPICRVTTIQSSQTFLERLMGVSKISIDSTANMSVQNAAAQVQMVFKTSTCKQIETIIRQSKKDVDGANLVSSENFSGSGLETRLKISDIVLSGLMHFRLIRNLFSYYGFKISDQNDTISISRGLISTKSFAFLKSGITGFEYSQNLIEKLAGFGTLRVFATGIGNDADNDSLHSVLHPMLKENQVAGFLANFSKDFDDKFQITGAAPGSLRYYFYRLSILITICILAVSLIISHASGKFLPIYISAALFLIAVASRILEKRNTALGFSPEVLLLQTGGFIKNRVYVKIDQAESITKRASIFKRKRGITSVSLDFLGDQLITHAELHNILIADADRIADKLTY